MAIVEQKIPEWKEEELKKISQQTLDEVLDRLNKNNRVLVVRPTGFGKSYMLAGLTSSIDNKGERRYKKSLYIYPTKVIKQDVINTYGPYGKDERANKLQNTTFISYQKIAGMIRDLEEKGEATLEGLELYKGIEDISSDGDWRPEGSKRLYKTVKIHKKIEGFQGSNSLRQWIKQFDLIMMDECHRAGSNGFLSTWKRIGSIIKKRSDMIKEEEGETPVKLVGVTATPDRLDGRDIKEIFGKSNQISRLTLTDCIKKGLLSKFDYVYAIGDRQKFLSTSIEGVEARRIKEGNSPLHEYEKEEMQREMDRLKPISEIIRESITEEHTGGNDYMRFVVFFENKRHIQKYKNIVQSWFEDAFIDKKVNIYNIVTKMKSDDITYEISDVDILEKLDANKKEGDVDLIFCVDKLNMGYHVESITGIMLLRETNSAVIYNQQIGRCFSVRSMTKPIIFDIVEKSGIGNILADDKEDKQSGEKADLPSIIDKSCVDTHTYGNEFIKLLNQIRLQKYDGEEIIVDFLKSNRHAPIPVISKMIGIEEERIEEIIKRREIE